ncbi:potassium channel family protein [Nocardioides jejuensis]|uniref:Two pore domain potassium channel family protein n=1 Tax=Nocardioides jejuensis TaxID=2502782 RepID=A0A4V2P007_9ACTN|nr:potassium channel family protein [Nocardioides jejuensis]TCJ31082.1 two pore domain potassium channel family protein [Nocardioides jejuensis]
MSDLDQHVRALKRNPCGVLLAVQLIGLLAYPYLGDQPVGRAIFGLLGLVVLTLAVRAVRLTPALTWVAIVLGIPVVVLTVLEGVTPDNSAIVATSGLAHAAFYGYTAWALIRYMFQDDVVTTDELWATGATFTVVAWAFAYLYAAVQVFWPGSFTAAVDADVPRTWIDLLFLSVTTLTSTGLSDIVPVKPHARSFVMVEQIAGMLYLAMVVARVTALTLRPARKG